MNTETLSPEQEVIEDLRRSFEARGLPFFSHPGAEIVPEFLRGYQPDALVRYKEGVGVIIDVRPRRNDQADRQLAQIA